MPSSGSRPTLSGALVLPGTPVTTATASTPSLLTTGGVASPVLQKVEKGRAEITALGEQLVRAGQDRDLAQTHVTAASQRVTDTQQALQQAREEAETAADATIQQAAALPPGALDSGLLELDALSRMQRGDSTSYEAAARRVLAAEEAAKAATADHQAAETRYSTLLTQWTTLNATLTSKQTAQATLEAANRDVINAAEAAANLTDQQLGSQILGGTADGRGADPRAVQALQFALAQRGDPYVWSEEGPDQYDCSGLMFAAYRGVGYPLVRVSRDQYYQTRDRSVSRYSLLPGDLLFFSNSSSWTGIHHVAMYAGEGMMVEAPRTGLNVRLAPVRWSRLFGATRVFGSIEGDTALPDLGAPDPDEPVTPTRSPSPTSTTKAPGSSTPPKPGTTTTGPKPGTTTTGPKPGTTTTGPKPGTTTTGPKPGTTTTNPNPGTTTTNPNPGTTTTTPAPGTTTTTPAPDTTTTTPAPTTTSASVEPEPTTTPDKTTSPGKTTSSTAQSSSGSASSTKQSASGGASSISASSGE
ncbi:C40 family peptidase [Actinoplanes utahensis]|uniref:C40 family peptidase n=1 Tax=Actinoplanes utahensis TaxID=1869 RepID=UPI000A55948A|nr:C40 family peptidase [Actinoplanes utahensis]